jgi:hypothetical protein
MECKVIALYLLVIFGFVYFAQSVLAQYYPTDPHQPTGPNAAFFEAAKAGSL